MKRTLLFLLTITLFTALASFTTARAGGPVNLVVTNCSNDTQLRAHLNEMQGGDGGTLSFNCGTATITLGSQLPEIKRNTTITSGRKITLSGLSAVRLFSVNNTGTLALESIVLESGYGGSANGGAIYSTGRVILDDATIQYSYTPFAGGAIYTTGRLDIINSTLAHNVAHVGGAIYAAGMNAQITITGSKFDDNRADVNGNGGAIYSPGSLSITNSEFANNTAGSGGAIYAPGLALTTTASITGSTFHDNKATGSYPSYGAGGALFAAYVPLSIQSSILNNNTGQSGGAIFVSEFGTLTMLDSTLSDNQSTNGGGIYNYESATLTNVTLSGNNASHGGGIDNAGTLGLTNVTLSGNNATYGGGLKHEGGSATLTNVTLSNNSAAADSGGGIWNKNSAFIHLYLKNVIVANSPTGGNCDFNKAPDSAIFSLSSDNTCTFGAGRDNVNLLLGSLANNGGATQTHLPQTGSPAIENGTATGAPSTDQRGIPRPQGAAFDVGAVEVCQIKPDKPMLLKPDNTKKVKGPAILLDWDDPLCAQKYKIKIKLGSATGSKVQTKGGLTTSEFTTMPLTKGLTYAWQVTAVNSVGKTKSEWWTFTVK